MNLFTLAQLPLAAGLWLLTGPHCLAQMDPEPRNLLEIGCDMPLAGRGLQGVYPCSYSNRPDLFSTNMDLRLAIAPDYLDGKLGSIPHPATNNSGFLDNTNFSINPPSGSLRNRTQ